jgi:hypothetical protein
MSEEDTSPEIPLKSARVQFRAEPQFVNLLKELSNVTGSRMTEVLKRAVVLYAESLDKASRGKTMTFSTELPVSFKTAYDEMFGKMNEGRLRPTTVDTAQEVQPGADWERDVSFEATSLPVQEN